MESIFDHPRFADNLFYPARRSSLPPNGTRDLSVVVAEGVALHVRFYEHASSRVRVGFFHGNGEVIADYDDVAERYHRLGADLAVVDYRGYGRSEGQPTARTCITDPHPVGVCFARTPTATGRELPLVIMGRSLGSMCAVELSRKPPAGTVGIVLESGFTDLDAFVRRRGHQPNELSAHDREDFDPLGKLRASTLPLLVLHGERDTLIPPEDGRRAYDASGARDRRMFLIPGRGHNDLSAHPLYWEAIGSFFGRVLRE